MCQAVVVEKTENNFLRMFPICPDASPPDKPWKRWRTKSVRPSNAISKVYGKMAYLPIPQPVSIVEYFEVAA